MSTDTTLFEFDHLFICTDLNAPAADRLVSAGLVEGSSNTHPGQGTANRRFFFHNAMLELLWVHDRQEAQSEAIAGTRLWGRWANQNGTGCPFGLCLRPATGGLDNVAFKSWTFRPPYLPETLSILVGTNSDDLAEPMLFQTPFGKRPDRFA
ncbi:MAG: VOC family protein, partial [Cyanobacteria bacterium P01_F01_bin.153]